MTFNVRDLFWLALVAAILGGWWRDHATLSSKRTEHANEVKTLRESRYFFALHMERLAELLDASDPDWERGWFDGTTAAIKEIKRADGDLVNPSKTMR